MSSLAIYHRCLFVVNAFLLGKHFTIFININVTALICFLGEGHVSLPSWCGQISLGSMGSTLLAFSFSAKCSNVFCKVFIYLFFNQVSLSSLSFTLMLYFDEDSSLSNKTTGIVLLQERQNFSLKWQGKDRSLPPLLQKLAFSEGLVFSCHLAMHSCSKKA